MSNFYKRTNIYAMLVFVTFSSQYCLGMLNSPQIERDASKAIDPRRTNISFEINDFDLPIKKAQSDAQRRIISDCPYYYIEGRTVRCFLNDKKQDWLFNERNRKRSKVSPQFKPDGAETFRDMYVHDWGLSYKCVNDLKEKIFLLDLPLKRGMMFFDPKEEKKFNDMVRDHFKLDFLIMNSVHSAVPVSSTLMKEILEGSATVYKIHLQIKPEYLASFIRDFSRFILKDPVLRKYITQFKFLHSFDKHEFGENSYPTVVIYVPLLPGTKKEKNDILQNIIQPILGRYVDYLDDIHLADCPPRFNSQVKGFVYIAGGDGDLKKKMLDGTRDYHVTSIRRQLLERRILSIYSDEDMHFFKGHEYHYQEPLLEEEGELAQRRGKRAPAPPRISQGRPRKMIVPRSKRAPAPPRVSPGRSRKMVVPRSKRAPAPPINVQSSEATVQEKPVQRVPRTTEPITESQARFRALRAKFERNTDDQPQLLKEEPYCFDLDDEEDEEDESYCFDLDDEEDEEDESYCFDLDDEEDEEDEEEE